MAFSSEHVYKVWHPRKVLFHERNEDRKIYIDFASVRKGTISKIKNRILLAKNEPTYQLFTGHIGCGKSTELLRIKNELQKKDYHVVFFDAAEYLDLSDIDTTEILLSIATNIIKSTKEIGINYPVNTLQGLWEDFKYILTEEVSEISIAGILSISRSTKDSSDLRKILRRRLEPKTSEVIRCINNDIIEYTRKELIKKGKIGLVVIVDGLEYIDNRILDIGMNQQKYIYSQRGDKLNKLNCHIVYTMPLALRFSDEIEIISERFDGSPSNLQMIPVKSRNGSINTESLELLRQTLLARVFPYKSTAERHQLICKVFDKIKTIDTLCVMSGGHIRGLLRMARSALVEKMVLPITRESVIKVIKDRHYAFSVTISEEENELLKNPNNIKEIASEVEHQNLLRNLFIFEYLDANGYWYSINPVLDIINL